MRSSAQPMPGRSGRTPFDDADAFRRGACFKHEETGLELRENSFELRGDVGSLQPDRKVGM
jgi:hypothetical protein